MIMNVNDLFDEFSAVPQVEALALGGSRATGRHDEKSDYDVYLYLTDSIDEAVRKAFWRNTALTWKFPTPSGNWRMM